MNLLLDTHVALWAITDSPRLSARARELIQSSNSSIWISIASIWEIAIKHALGCGEMPLSAEDSTRYFRESGYRLLAIEVDHTLAVERLSTHHHDPFDRMLVAQALTEPMRLVTHDVRITHYSNTILKV